MQLQDLSLFVRNLRKKPKKKNKNKSLLQIPCIEINKKKNVSVLEGKVRENERYT